MMNMPNLHQFFRRQLQAGLSDCTEPATIEYVSDLLTRFADTRSLYAIHNERGESLEHIATMLMEYYRAQGMDDYAPNPQKEALIALHIGEYTLFMSGLFRERLTSRGELNYYVDNGATAYARCADYTYQPERKRIFGSLYYSFKTVSNALDHWRHEYLPLKIEDVDRDALIAAIWRT